MAGGLNAMDEVNPSLGQRTRRMDDLTNTFKVVIVAAEVGDAMQTIWAREVQDILASCFMPSDLFCTLKFATQL